MLVSNFGMTCNSLCEFHTLDRLRHVGALPGNRLRRRHVLKHTTQLPCIRCVTFRRLLSQLCITPLTKFPRSIVTLVSNRSSFLPIAFLQYGHCTFAIILCRPFRRLLINLTMCENALFSKLTTTLGLVEQAFRSLEVIPARPSRRSTAGTLSFGTSGPRWVFAHSAA